MNFAQTVCLDDFYFKLKLGHLVSKTRSPGQIKEDLVNTLEVKFETGSHGVKKLGYQAKSPRGHIFEAIIVNLAQNVCLDEFYVKFETGSPRVRN